MKAVWSIVILLALSACSTPVPPESSAPAEAPPAMELADATEAPAEPTAHEKVHWGYEGEIGPEHWAALDPKNYERCGTGKLQSPIDLPGEVEPTLADVTFDYKESAVKVINNGHTIQVEYEDGSYIEIEGQRYPLVQIHFHAPSEHAVADNHYPIEMHLVHKNEAGVYAVVGVFIEEGAANAAFTPVWDHLPATEIEKPVATGTTINAADLLPATQSLYRYTGSLTTPGCNEGVIWSVMNTPVSMSAAQIDAFTAIYSDNNRPLQPLAGQIVQVGEAADAGAEVSEPASVQIAQCSTDDIPAPTEGAEVRLRFVNSSSAPVAVLWRDTIDASGELVEYTQLAAGDSFDQNTYIGHEWLLNDLAGNTLLEYTAASDPLQCVLIE